MGVGDAPAVFPKRLTVARRISGADIRGQLERSIGEPGHF